MAYVAGHLSVAALEERYEACEDVMFDGIGAFFLMSATGVLMFFGLDRGLAGEAHEWFSWLFLAGAGAHIAANSRPFMNHLKSPLGQGKRRDVRRRPRRLAHCGFVGVALYTGGPRRNHLKAMRRSRQVNQPETVLHRTIWWG
jgi:hypothetical protein